MKPSGVQGSLRAFCKILTKNNLADFETVFLTEDFKLVVYEDINRMFFQFEKSDLYDILIMLSRIKETEKFPAHIINVVAAFPEFDENSIILLVKNMTSTKSFALKAQRDKAIIEAVMHESKRDASGVVSKVLKHILRQKQ